ncbi:hypothetical protein EJB05_17009, partial [Eragrostis curvula]
MKKTAGLAGAPWRGEEEGSELVAAVRVEEWKTGRRWDLRKGTEEARREEMRASGVLLGWSAAIVGFRDAVDPVLPHQVKLCSLQSLRYSGGLHTVVAQEGCSQWARKIDLPSPPSGENITWMRDFRCIMDIYVRGIGQITDSLFPEVHVIGNVKWPGILKEAKELSRLQQRLRAHGHDGRRRRLRAHDHDGGPRQATEYPVCWKVGFDLALFRVDRCGNVLYLHTDTESSLASDRNQSFPYATRGPHAVVGSAVTKMHVNDIAVSKIENTIPE